MNDENFVSAGLRFLSLKNLPTYGVLIKKTNIEKKVVIPKAYKGISVTHILGVPINTCKNLEEIVIPSSIVYIGTDVFNGTSLKSLTIPSSVKEIGKGYTGFISGCNKLTSILVEKENTVYRSENNCLIKDNILIAGCNTSVIPISITHIEQYAFCGLSFTNISIPSSVTDIRNHAFCGCESLSSIIIPSSVKIIGEFCFSNCPKLKNIYYSGTKAEWDAIRVGAAHNNSITHAAIDSIIPKIATVHYECRMSMPEKQLTTNTQEGNFLNQNLWNIAGLTVKQYIELAITEHAGNLIDTIISCLKQTEKATTSTQSGHDSP